MSTERAPTRARSASNLAAVGAVFAVLVATAVTATEPLTAAGPSNTRTGPVIVASTVTANAGGSVTVRGEGFPGGSAGTLTLDGAQGSMPAYRASRSGRFSVSVTVPEATTAGWHLLGARPKGEQAEVATTPLHVDVVTTDGATPGRIDGSDETAAPATSTSATLDPTLGPTLEPSFWTGPQPTADPSDTGTPYPSSWATFGPDPAPDPTDAATPTPSPTPRPDPTRTPRPTAAPTPTPTPSPTPRPTATPQPTPTQTPTPTEHPCDLIVSPNGSDSNSGAPGSPFRTIKYALSRPRAGQTLCIREGTYTENVTGVSLAQGSASSRIVTMAYPGESPVIVGLLWLNNPTYWTFRGINVTWNTANASNQHMVKLSGGTGWIFERAELWGARSYAAVLIGSTTWRSSDWIFRQNCVHDTVRSNNTNQDHNVYIDTGLSAGPGLFTRNLVFNAPNGDNVKLGGPSSSTGGAANVMVSYNTLYNASQPINVSFLSANNRIARNLIGRATGTSGLISAFHLTGTGNEAANNLGFDAASMFSWESGYNRVADGGGNVFPRNPDFDRIGCGGFHPADGAAQDYGRYAP